MCDVAMNMCIVSVFSKLPS